MRVSVIIPVVRPSSAQILIESLPSWVEIIAEEDKKDIGCIRMVNRLIKKTTNEVVVFLGDDCVAHSNLIESGIKKLLLHKNTLGIVGLKTYPNNNIAHWMFNKRILQLFEGGKILSPAYHHCFSDSELYLKAKQLGMWSQTDMVVLDHNHPINGNNWDEWYDRAYTGWMHKDAKVFHGRTGIKPNVKNMTQDIKKIDILVHCNKRQICHHVCHHSQPHFIEQVTQIGSRYNSFEMDISCCPENLCIEQGMCDMGIIVKCVPVKNTFV